MKPGLPLARLLAAMILAVVAWAVPSAAGAHEGHGVGHGHHARRRAPVVTAEASPVLAAEAATARVVLRRPGAFPAERTIGATAASLRSDDEDCAACAGSHGLCCCGAACCAPGILAAAVTLPAPGLVRAVLRPGDAAARAGLGPASVTEPPRPLA